MPVIVKEYSSKLIERFTQEKCRLFKLLPINIKIEHVGSSAVFIGGKNIIDILIGFPKHEDMISIKNILTKNGYFEGHDSHEDRIFLASTKEETGEGDFHIHICPIKEESYENFIILRNFLKNNPEKAQEYLKKKYEFAKEANFDRKKYKALKSVYVSELLTEAKNRALLRATNANGIENRSRI